MAGAVEELSKKRAELTEQRQTLGCWIFALLTSGRCDVRWAYWRRPCNGWQAVRVVADSIETSMPRIALTADQRKERS
jgi:hypothetical protein